MMPHIDETRIYWKNGPPTLEDNKYKQEQLRQRMELKNSPDSAKRAFFKAFIEPDLGPKPAISAPGATLPLYSFIDAHGDEIRISIHPATDYECDWFVEIWSNLYLPGLFHI